MVIALAPKPSRAQSFTAIPKLALPVAPKATQDTQAHVLVVDDENGPRQALRMLLKEEFHVHVASHVLEALQILVQEPIKLIVTDVRMPDLSGVDLLRRSKAINPDVQVIMLTGYGQLESAMKAVEYGALTYMEKPFDNDTLLRSAHRGIERFSEEKRRRVLEELALEANRFETVGRVVSGMMHDLATPLTVLTTQLDLMEAYPERTNLGEKIESMRTQVYHCSDLVRATMDCMRKESIEFEDIRLRTVVDSSLKVARSFLAEHRVELVLDLGDDLPEVHGEVTLLRQAVLNLICNAGHALAETDGPRRVELKTWADSSGQYLSVTDNGPGVPPEIKSKIFETLYTTKGELGTGLGLGVVESVMNRHQGDVRLETADDGGARFVLRFPAHA